MGIMNKPPSKEYQEGWDKIFGKNKRPTEQDVKELGEVQQVLTDMYGWSKEDLQKRQLNKPRLLSEIERADLREDLKLTVQIAKETKNE